MLIKMYFEKNENLQLLLYCTFRTKNYTELILVDLKTVSPCIVYLLKEIFCWIFFNQQASGVELSYYYSLGIIMCFY